ncbi:MAG: methyltransferase, FkbM family [Bacteroidota bacterium]|nr:methyltransferase, FkbM family [Bacteroidota bacterium]
MNKQLIYDIGTFDGSDTDHYLKMGYHVVSVEANPVLANKAKERFKKQIDSGQLTLLNVGISNETGENIEFWINDTNFEWSSFIKEIGCRAGTSCHRIEITTTTTDALFKKYGVPFYLKVDIEGNDIHCINGLNEADLPKYFSCEAQEVGWLDKLKEKGYTKFKIINQGDNFNELDIRKEKSKFHYYRMFLIKGIKNRTQHFIHFKYPLKSSGPFGENSKGEWKSYEEVRELYLAFFQFEKNIPINDISHFDFHATY